MTNDPEITILQCDQFIGDLTGEPFTETLVHEIKVSAFNRWLEVKTGLRSVLEATRVPWATTQWLVQPDGTLAKWRARWDSSG